MRNNKLYERRTNNAQTAKQQQRFAFNQRLPEFRLYLPALHDATYPYVHANTLILY